MAVISNGTAVLGLGQHRGPRRQAGDGGQGGAVQAVRGHRRVRPRARDRGHRGVHPGGQAPRADVRRDQPRGHPGARVLRDRAAPEGGDEHPGLPRRPARHGDHLRRGAPQRPRAGEARRSTRCGSSSPAPGRRRSRACRLCLELGLEQENVVLCDRLGRGLDRDGRGRWTRQGAARGRDQGAHAWPRRSSGADVFIGLSVAGVAHAARWCAPWRSDPIVFAMANPDSRDLATRRRARRARTRSSPPGAATTRTRSTTSSASRSSSAARSTCGRPTSTMPMKLAAVRALAELAREDVPDARPQGLRPRVAPLRPRVPDPQAVRPPRAPARRAGGGAGGRWRAAWRGSRSRTSRRTGGGSRRSISRRLELMRGVLDQARRAPKRIVFPEGEHDKILRDGEDPGRRGDRAPDPARPARE